MKWGDRRVQAAVLLLITLKLVFHAFYLPVWEGPDEPFHMGRILPPETEGSREPELQHEIALSVADHPCADDLRRVFGCKPFDGNGAFNILERRSPGPDDAVEPVTNYESHQPPTYYAVVGSIVRAFSITDPLNATLLARLLSVVFVVAGLVMVGRISNSAGLFLTLLLLLPGAGEALVRTANDSLVFLACAIVMLALSRQNDRLLVVAIAVAPTIKLTAAPIVASTLVYLWSIGRRKLALVTLIASLLVIPIQAFRGWAWGGTVELNQAAITLDEPIGQSIAGLARTAYTIAKTTLWLGNWSFFRAPVFLLILAALLVACTLAASKPSGSTAARLSLLAGTITLSAGVVAFAIAHRSLFGQWGGVGGWYLWGLMPWLAVGLTETLQLRSGARRAAIVSSVALVILFNVFWLHSAMRIYGPA